MNGIYIKYSFLAKFCQSRCELKNSIDLEQIPTFLHVFLSVAE